MKSGITIFGYHLQQQSTLELIMQEDTELMKP